MAYLWVAIGGALGSVARFWFANLMAVLVGSEFPWGTLIINIVGSFVISFFGALTGSAARFAVPYEARIHDIFVVQPANHRSGADRPTRPGGAICWGLDHSVPGWLRPGFRRR